MITRIKHFLRISYLVARTRILNVFYGKPKVKSDVETIDRILSEGASVSRFGDGEIAIINGQQLGFQNSDKKLAHRLDQVLRSKSDMMICIPDIYTVSSIRKLTFDSKIFWLNELLHNRHIWYSIPKDTVYYDACITRPYIRIRDKNHSRLLFEKLKEVWRGRDVVIVEGKQSRLGVGNDLFDDCHRVSRILCPPKNAFAAYEAILDACTQLPKDVLLLLSLGPTASVLAYDLNELGYQAFDLGHIDLEYEWYLQKAATRTVIKHKAVNELYTEAEMVHDEMYEKQIIKIID